MIAYDRNAFYAAVRQPIFSGHMTPSQVEGCDAILSEAEKRGLAGASSAYILATAFWETGRKMQPVSEIGKGQNKPYGVPDPQTR